jgi:hypothetical protein
MARLDEIQKKKRNVKHTKKKVANIKIEKPESDVSLEILEVPN